MKVGFLKSFHRNNWLRAVEAGMYNDKQNFIGAIFANHIGMLDFGAHSIKKVL